MYLFKQLCSLFLAGEVFKGAAAIVTLPLGCLKAGGVAFQPSLPPWKAEAIAKLGYGDLNKVRPWWVPWTAITGEGR